MTPKNTPKSPRDISRAIGIRLENFRPFRDSGWFQIAPLTCIVGANSSGKSSIISAILLLKQSLQQERMSTRVTPLLLSGPYCDLGSFREVVYGHRMKSPIGFAFRVPASLLRQTFNAYHEPLIALNVPSSVMARRSAQRQVYLSASSPNVYAKNWVDVKLSFVTDAPFGPSLSQIELNVNGLGSAYFRRTTRGERRQHWRGYTQGLPNQSIAMSFFPYAFFPYLVVRRKGLARQSPRMKSQVRRFVATAERALIYIRRFLNMSEVIGPFRTPPERRYAFGGFSSSRSGPRGEQAVDLLVTEKLLKTAHHPLQSAVSYWLQHLQLAQTVSVESLAKNINLFQLNLAGVGGIPQANVADVGFGISQILPVIVQGLLMRPGGVYMVQQPELHLHPDAQAGLADFFLYLVSSGIRVIVETHSEYLLIRLRRRLAEGKLNLSRTLPGPRGPKVVSKDMVAVLLTEPSKKGPGSTVTELALGDSFQFENLPKNFMSQAIEDRLALLKAVGK